VPPASHPQVADEHAIFARFGRTGGFCRIKQHAKGEKLGTIPIGGQNGCRLGQTKQAASRMNVAAFDFLN
jgi:hypothetical protein